MIIKSQQWLQQGDHHNVTPHRSGNSDRKGKCKVCGHNANNHGIISGEFTVTGNEKFLCPGDFIFETHNALLDVIQVRK